MLDAECFSAADGLLEAGSEDCLDSTTDFGDDDDDFAAAVSGIFLLGPLLFVVAEDGLDDDTVGLDALAFGGFESVLGFVGFLVVESLEPSFSSPFLGDAGFLLVKTEPGRGEAVHNKYTFKDLYNAMYLVKKNIQRKYKPGFIRAGQVLKR